MARKLKKPTLAKNILDNIAFGLAYDKPVDAFIDMVIEANNKKIAKCTEDIKIHRSRIKILEDLKKEWKKDKKKFVDKYASRKLKSALGNSKKK